MNTKQLHQFIVTSRTRQVIASAVSVLLACLYIYAMWTPSSVPEISTAQAAATMELAPAVTVHHTATGDMACQQVTVSGLKQGTSPVHLLAHSQGAVLHQVAEVGPCEGGALTGAGKGADVPGNGTFMLVWRLGETGASGNLPSVTMTAI